MPQPIRYDSITIDLHDRFQQYNTVDASPTDATETVIATLTLSNFNDMAVQKGIRLRGWAAFTVGTSGVSALLRIKQTNTSGSTKASSGAVTETAANLDEVSCNGFDTGAGVATYVLTLTVASAAAASTVSACSLEAIII